MRFSIFIFIIIIQVNTVCVCLVAQSCLTLCDSLDCSLPGSSVHGVFQARILEWIALPFPGDLSNPGMEPVSLGIPALQADSFPAEPLN